MKPDKKRPHLDFLNNQISLFTGHPMDNIKVSLIMKNKPPVKKKSKKGKKGDLSKSSKNQSFTPKADLTKEELATEAKMNQSVALKSGQKLDDKGDKMMSTQ
jgi:hypothetical protein